MMQSAAQWVACDLCGRWRKIPSFVNMEVRTFVLLPLFLLCYFDSNYFLFLSCFLSLSLPSPSIILLRHLLQTSLILFKLLLLELNLSIIIILSQFYPIPFSTTLSFSLFHPFTPFFPSTLCAPPQVIPQLESMIKQKMTPTLVDRVDFSTEGEIFVDLVAHTLKVR